MTLDWWCLQITVFGICVGTILHGFFCASFCVENALKKIPLIPMIFLGWSDLLITMVVMPCIVVILFMEKFETLCFIILLSTKISIYFYNLIYMQVALEHYFRLCGSTAAYRSFTALRIEFIILTMIGLSITCSAVELYLHSRSHISYCDRSPFDYVLFRFCSFFLLLVIPCMVTVSCLFATAKELRIKSRVRIQNRRCIKHQRDIKSTNVHIFAYLLFAVAWSPYLMVLLNPDSSDRTYYLCFGIGLSRAVVSSGIYGCWDWAFRKAFGRMLNCLFLTSNRLSSRQRRHGIDRRTNQHTNMHMVNDAVQTSLLQSAPLEDIEMTSTNYWRRRSEPQPGEVRYGLLDLPRP